MLLIVHSCKGREWVLEYWWKFFKKNVPQDLFRVNCIVDDGVFSDQLIETLEEIEDEYIWYTLDDYWILYGLNYRACWFYAQQADCIRFQPNVVYESLPYRFYPTHYKDFMLRQAAWSPYHFSAATSIWRRKYLLENLTPGLDPWQLERTPFQNFGSTYFIRNLSFWYIDGTRRGILTDKGKKAIAGL